MYLTKSLGLLRKPDFLDFDAEDGKRLKRELDIFSQVDRKELHMQGLETRFQNLTRKKKTGECTRYIHEARVARGKEAGVCMSSSIGIDWHWHWH